MRFAARIFQDAKCEPAEYRPLGSICTWNERYLPQMTLAQAKNANRCRPSDPYSRAETSE
jgi:hypothetical protein